MNCRRKIQNLKIENSNSNKKMAGSIISTSTSAEARRWLKFVDFYVDQCRNEESEAKQFASHTYEAQYYTKLAEMSRHEVMIFRNKAQLAEHKATNDALLSLLTTVKVQTSHSVVKIYESCVQVNVDMAQICDVIVQTIHAYNKANKESFQICGPKASSTSNYDLTPICEAGFVELYQAFVSFDKACDSLQNELRLSSSDTRKFTSELYVIEAINCEKEASMYRKQASKYRNYITQCRLNAAPNTIKVESGSSSLTEISETKKFALQIPSKTANSNPEINKVACSLCGRYYLKRGIKIHMRSCQVKNY